MPTLQGRMRRAWLHQGWQGVPLFRSRLRSECRSHCRCFVDTYKTGKLPDRDILALIKENCDFRPGMISINLDPKRGGKFTWISPGRLSSSSRLTKLILRHQQHLLVAALLFISAFLSAGLFSVCLQQTNLCWHPCFGWVCFAFAFFPSLPYREVEYVQEIVIQLNLKFRDYI